MIELRFTKEELKNDPEAQKWLDQCGRVINQELNLVELGSMPFEDTHTGELNEQCRDKEKI